MSRPVFQLFVPARHVRARAALIEAAADAIREGRSLWIVGPNPNEVQTATEFLRATCFPMLMLGNPNRVPRERRDCRP